MASRDQDIDRIVDRATMQMALLMGLQIYIGFAIVFILLMVR